MTLDGSRLSADGFRFFLLVLGEVTQLRFRRRWHFDPTPLAGVVKQPMGRRRKRSPNATGNLRPQERPAPGQAQRPPAVLGAVRPRDWLFAAALVVAVFLAYQPAWQGGFVWDDDTHLLNNPVLKPGGVFRTWVPGSYVNYWPLTFTAYWLQYQLWGLEPVGFHLVNIALARPFGDSDLARSRLAARAGRAAGGGPVRAAPGQRRERGLDHATEKHPVVGADPAFRAVLFAPGAGPACRAGPLDATDPARQSASRSRLPGGTLGRDKPGSPSPASRSRLPGGTLGGATDPALPSPASRSRLPGGTLGDATDPAAPSPARQAGPTGWYVAAVAAFALATLAKGMTLTLPVVLLACAWWQRGRIQRRDLWRVLPFLLIGS